MTTPSPDAKALAMEALRPFAEFATGWELGAHGSELADDSTTRNSYMRLGDYRRARKALAALKQLQTPAPQPEELRGLIARMIDEGVWAKVKTVDGVVCIVYSGVEETADRILQLLPSYRPPEGYVVVPMGAGSCEGDDSGWILAFLNALHAHLPEDERPTSWMQFSDDQRLRIQAAYAALISAAPPPPSPEAQGEKL